MNFYRKSLEVRESNDSFIPEPQSLEVPQPEALPTSPKASEIDSMFNLLLSDKQEHRNQFAQEYLERKIDRRLREIEELSTEKKRNNWIQDAKVVLKQKVNDTYSKNDRNFYKMHFSSTPDPAYLRSASDVMTDAEVLKQRMKKSNINSKAEEIVNTFYWSSKRGKKRGKKQLKPINQSLDRESKIKSESIGTDGIPIRPDFIDTHQGFQRMNTFEDTFESLNNRDEDSPNFQTLDNQEKKGKVIMNMGNLVTKLEGLVKQLNHQITYLNTDDWNEDVVDKISKYHQLIDSQIASTLNLSSFKYLQNTIDTAIEIPKYSMNSSLSHNSINSSKVRHSQLISPVPTKHMDMWLSNPTFKRSNPQGENKQTENLPSVDRSEQVANLDSMLNNYKIFTKTAEQPKVSWRKGKKSKFTIKSTQNSKRSHQKKNKAAELNKKINDMRHTTAEIVNRRKNRKSATNYEIKNKKASMPLNSLGVKTLVLGENMSPIVAGQNFWSQKYSSTRNQVSTQNILYHYCF